MHSLAPNSSNKGKMRKWTQSIKSILVLDAKALQYYCSSHEMFNLAITNPTVRIELFFYFNKKQNGKAK